MANSTKTPVSVLGLGKMGAAIAKAFIQKGHPVALWNRSLGKADSLVSLGGRTYDTAEECIRFSKLVVVILTGHHAFEAVFGAIARGTGSGRIVVDFGTGSPSQLRASAALAQQQSFDAYIHAAILAFPHQVGLADTVSAYSGPAQPFKQVEDVLKALGRTTYLDDDDPARAALHEVILDTAYYTMSAGFMQSMALLKRAGLWTPGFAETFTTESILPLLRLAEDSLVGLARQIDKGEYTADETGVRLENHLAAVRNFIQTYNDMKVSPLGLESLAAAIEERVSQGGRDEELSGLVHVL